MEELMVGAHPRDGIPSATGPQGWLSGQERGVAGGRWELRDGYLPGDVGFDPLGMKPVDGAGLLAMQDKELNNGRLAMIAVAGMTVQELVTDATLF